MEEHDAVIVGARCAGATLAAALAQRGWDVLMIDRDEMPSDTISTHLIYPNTLARLQQFGALERLRAEHDLALVKHRLRGLGHEISGTFTPVDGFDRIAAPRRRVLDKAIVETALASGAEGSFGNRVVDLIGAGTQDDPVRGVMMEDGRRIGARWVFGADGRGSVVASRLGLEKKRRQRGEVAFSYSYWKGIAADGYATLQIEPQGMLYHGPVEDGLHILIVSGAPDLAQGSRSERRRKHEEAIRSFPETFDPGRLDGAEMIDEVAVAPESMMRGFFRTATGPGWALVGDAGHFKHPGTAQGIGDAVEQAFHVAEALSGPKPGLDGYERWRDQRSAEHYDWSFDWGRFPKPETGEPLFRGMASEPDAGQDLRDCLARQIEPSQLMSAERRARWFGAERGTAPEKAPAG